MRWFWQAWSRFAWGYNSVICSFVKNLGSFVYLRLLKYVMEYIYWHTFYILVWIRGALLINYSVNYKLWHAFEGDSPSPVMWKSQGCSYSQLLNWWIMLFFGGASMQGENNKPDLCLKYSWRGHRARNSLCCLWAFPVLPIRDAFLSPVWLSLLLCTSLWDRREPGGPVLLGACRHNGDLTHGVGNS